MSVVIRLSRCDNKERDDVISIRRRMNGGLLVRYVDANLPRNVWISDKTYSEVMHYLQRIFAGLNMEIDPFKGLQLDVPGYPLVFYHVPDLSSEVVTRIMETIREWIISPPSSFFQ
jgi:hypothetical protein